MDKPPTRVITTSEQIGQDWLNAVLSRSGAIKSGRVTDFHATPSTSTNAHIVRIRLSYSPDSRGKLPKTLILKLCSGGDLFIADSEVNYYNRDYLDLANAPVPRCYDAQFSSDTGSYHILMEDLTETHEKDHEPTIEHGVEVAKSLAAMHAHGWGTQPISAIAPFMNHVRQGLLPLLEATKSDINDDWRTIISEVFERYPARMLERTKDPRGFAVLHGDLNPGNILSPRDTNGKIYFLDRQPFKWSLTTWLAVSDLVIMMVPYWPQDARRKLETSILKEYHTHLLQYGITDYNWDQLMLDYRLSAFQSLFIAAEWCIQPDDRQRMRWLWWQELQNAMAVIADFKCMELL